MKRFFLGIVAMAAMFVGCQNDPAGIKEALNEPEFKATFDTEDTRVYLGEDNYYRWEAGDKVSVFSLDNRNRLYEAEDADTVYTDLIFVSKPQTIPNPEYDLGMHYAIYPYNENNKLTTDGVLISSLSAEQIHNANKPNLDYAIMTSTIPTADKVFHFKNSCALIKLNVRTTAEWEGDFTLNSVKVESKSNYLAGTMAIDVTNDDFIEKYTAKIYEEAGDATKSITLSDCESVGPMTTEYKTFIIAIPAGTYPENDLTFTLDCSEDFFDCSVTVPTGYEVNRSKFMEFNITLSKTFDGTFDELTDSIEQTEDPEGNITIAVKKPFKTNKALIADIDNLLSQNFDLLYRFKYIYEVPSRDAKSLTIDGSTLEEDAGDDAQNVHNNTITFYPDRNNGEEFPTYVINTFTTLSGGIANVTPAKVTVNNIELKGKLRCSTMGIYSNGTTAGAVGFPTGAVEGEKAEPTNFNTEWNNVIANGLQIIPYLGKNSAVAGGIGAAVMCYGTAVLNNCQVTGTVASDDVATREDLVGIPIYDLAGDNSAKVTINGGKVGNIYGWEHSKYTFKGGAEIGSITTIALYIAKKDNGVIVEDATVGTLYARGNGSYTSKDTYATKIEVKAGATVNTLKFGQPFTNFSRVTIEEGATVGTVILEGQGTDGADLEMTLAEFKTNYLNK